jgi:transcription initiation factor TFIID subunit 5
MWDLQSGHQVRLFSGHFGAVRAVAISPDGRMLATSGDDPFINIWDLGSGKKMHTLQGHTGRVHSLDFSMEGSTGVLASGGDDDTVRIWDVQRGLAKGAPKLSAAPPAEPRPVASTPVNTFYTKRTPVVNVRFTNRNLLLAAGVFSANVDAPLNVQ